MADCRLRHFEEGLLHFGGEKAVCEAPLSSAPMAGSKI